MTTQTVEMLDIEDVEAWAACIGSRMSNGTGATLIGVPFEAAFYFNLVDAVERGVISESDLPAHRRGLPVPGLALPHADFVWADERLKLGQEVIDHPDVANGRVVLFVNGGTEERFIRLDLVGDVVPEPMPVWEGIART